MKDNDQHMLKMMMGLFEQMSPEQREELCKKSGVSAKEITDKISKANKYIST